MVADAGLFDMGSSGIQIAKIDTNGELSMEYELKTNWDNVPSDPMWIDNDRFVLQISTISSSTGKYSKTGMMQYVFENGNWKQYSIAK